MPEDGTNGICKLVTTINQNTYEGFQIYYNNNGTVYYRWKFDNAWRDWKNYRNDILDFKYEIINASNYASIMPDLNSASESGYYSFLFTANQSYPANLPVTPSGEIELLYHKKLNNNGAYQLYFTKQNIYRRWKYNNSWQPWINYKKQFLDYNYDIIQQSNYASIMPDLNTVSESGYYAFLFTANQNYPAHLPVVPNGRVEMLYHKVLSNNSAFQIYYSDRRGIFMRWKYANNWYDWLGGSQNIIYCGTGESYTTLKSAIDYSNTVSNVTIYVKEGTYDLYEEYGGDTYFDEYTSETANVGLVLKNNVHIIFSPKSKVVFNNENENTAIADRFSPFNSGNGGFTIENLTLECSNCHYAIHDERGASVDQYENKYINCYIEKSGTGLNACIGGGLGDCGKIEINSCYFDVPNATSSTGIVFYHNNWDTSKTASQSNLIVKNNYLKHGTFALRWAGASTKITRCICTNNRTAGNILHESNGASATIENTELISWNNTTT